MFLNVQYIDQSGCQDLTQILTETVEAGSMGRYRASGAVQRSFSSGRRQNKQFRFDSTNNNYSRDDEVQLLFLVGTPLYQNDVSAHTV